MVEPVTKSGGVVIRLALTGSGMKLATGCSGIYPEPCRQVFPRTKQAWCSACLEAEG